MMIDFLAKNISKISIIFNPKKFGCALHDTFIFEISGSGGAPQAGTRAETGWDVDTP